ncbi:hypothetical protein HK101_008946 [Irineochytrium annulatum]|nr:hypothetical protein HK101_008946 [Irineochytrium annulatum]
MDRPTHVDERTPLSPGNRDSQVLYLRAREDALRRARRRNIIICLTTFLAVLLISAIAGILVDLAAVADKRVNMDQLSIDLDAMRLQLGVRGLAVGVVRNGEIVYQRGFGERNAEGGEVTGRTMFRIASMTKSFTALGVVMASDAGKVDLRTPVTEYAPAVGFLDPVAEKQTSLIDLMSHRTGQPRHDYFGNGCKSMEDLVAGIKFLEPHNQFREKWEYNNNMFVLAGYISAKAFGTSWHELIVNRILTPLGMHASRPLVGDDKMTGNFATGYSMRPDGTEFAFDSVANGEQDPAGAIVSNVEEMAKYMAFMERRGVLPNGTRLVSEKAFDSLWKSHMTMDASDYFPIRSYGLGWNNAQYRKTFIHFHGGNMDGFSSMMAIAPSHNLSVVVLCNRQASVLRDAATNLILDRIFDGERKLYDGIMANRTQGTSTSLPVEAFAGTYVHPAYGVIELRVLSMNEGEEARMAMLFKVCRGRETRLELGHWQYDEFAAFPESEFVPMVMIVAFERNGDGIASLRVKIEPEVAPIVFRREEVKEVKLAEGSWMERWNKLPRWRPTRTVLH